MKTSLSGRRTSSTLALRGSKARSRRSAQIPVGARCSCPSQMCPTMAQLPGSCCSTSLCSCVALTIHQLWKFRATQNSHLGLCPVQRTPHVPLGDKNIRSPFYWRNLHVRTTSTLCPGCHFLSASMPRESSGFTLSSAQVCHRQVKGQPQAHRTHLKSVPASLDASGTLARLPCLWVRNRTRTKEIKAKGEKSAFQKTCFCSKQYRFIWTFPLQT